MVFVVAYPVKDYILEVVVDELSVILTEFILIVDVELFLDERDPFLVDLALLDEHFTSASVAHVIKGLSDVQNLVQSLIEEAEPQQKVRRS